MILLLMSPSSRVMISESCLAIEFFLAPRDVSSGSITSEGSGRL